MKKFAVSFLLICLIILSGCGGRELNSAKILRDDVRTGGSLSFVYDSNQRTVFIGDEGEVVQYSVGDDNEGNRVGIKVIAPDEKLNLDNASLKMNGVNYSNFLEVINGQKQRFFNLYPIFNEKQKTTSFSVKWSDNTKEQTYKLVIVEGTKFMKKDGSVE